MSMTKEINLKHSGRTLTLDGRNLLDSTDRIKAAIDAEVKAALKAHGIDTGSAGAGDGNSDPYAGVVRPARGTG